MSILLTGAAGQLGQELLPRLQPLGDVTCIDRAAGDFPGQLLKQDLGDLNRVEILLNRLRPDVIVNTAAYTAVDRAENDTFPTFHINAELPGCLARWAARNDCLLLHYSTDYVFSGDSARPYREDDPTGPRNAYGESKLAGELAIAASGCRHLILRTSWVYSGHGNNFVLTMLRLASERPALSIVADQTGRPTWARNLARVSGELLAATAGGSAAARQSGIWHYCDNGIVSWYDFARSIFDAALAAGVLARLPELTPVSSAQFPQQAERPLYSVLDTSRIQADFGIRPAGLSESLTACIQELKQHEEN